MEGYDPVIENVRTALQILEGGRGREDSAAWRLADALGMLARRGFEGQGLTTPTGMGFVIRREM